MSSTKKHKTPYLIFFLLYLLIFGTPTVTHHEAGSYYSGFLLREEPRQSGHSPSGHIGAGALLVPVVETFETIFFVVGIPARLILETCLIPYDSYHRDAFLKKDGMHIAKEVGSFRHALDVYKAGYLADASPLSNAVILQMPITELERLSAEGVSVDAKDEMGFTPFDYALVENNLAVVQWLIEEKGVAINPETVISVVRNGRLKPEIFVYLLDNGLDPNTTDEDGDSLLHFAAAYKTDAVAMKLLELGADIHKTNESGKTVLRQAVRYRKQELIEQLIQRGADFRAVDKRGETVLFSAKGEQLIYFLKAGLDINQQNNAGKTPLLEGLSRYTNDMSIFAGRVKTLLENGADPNIPNNRGFTPLMRAAHSGMDDVVGLLVNGGADLDAQDKHGRSALMLALSGEHSQVAERLLLAGAWTHLYDWEFHTAYDYAKSRKDVKLLNKYKTKPQKK
jgi:ankyrin repeat protein